jgi:hypothetical protein
VRIPRLLPLLLFYFIAHNVLYVLQTPDCLDLNSRGGTNPQLLVGSVRIVCTRTASRAYKRWQPNTRPAPGNSRSVAKSQIPTESFSSNTRARFQTVETGAAGVIYSVRLSRNYRAHLMRPKDTEQWLALKVAHILVWVTAEPCENPPIVNIKKLVTATSDRAQP